jgi:CheY-like chemotaxis protein
LVDDSDDDEFLTRRALKKAGFACDVLRVLDGQQAISYFARTGVYADRQKYPETQLVFLDIHMPRVSGFDVLTWLRDHPVDPPPYVVIMLSSAKDTRDRLQAAALGAHNYCAKPPGPQLFAELAERHGFTWISAGAGPELLV